AAPGPSYRIQIGDQLHVRFLYQPDMSEELPVRPDGRISLLATGELDVVGLTPTELERLIVERSSAHLREPEVTVIVTKLGERRGGGRGGGRGARPAGSLPGLGAPPARPPPGRRRTHADRGTLPPA